METRKRNKKTIEKTALALTLERMDKKCGNCRPLTPLECTEGCDVWRFKNELRQLNMMITEKGFSNTLLNTVKNRRRLQILEMLSIGSFSVPQLQKELKRLGYVHSQKTIINEYVEPLIAVGLIAHNSSCYRATIFGYEVSRLFAGFLGIGNILAPHSECYEEKIIENLSEGAKTFEELKLSIHVKSLPRVLERLQKSNLVTKDDENNYVFYFKTKRNPQQERLSSTMKRVHENVPEEGITAEKLAEKTNITLRRTYKYLRKLRGKKLVFKRKLPKKYSLTAEGMKVAEVLRKMQEMLSDFAQVSTEVTKALGVFQSASAPDSALGVEEKPLQVLVKSDVPHKAY